MPEMRNSLNLFTCFHLNLSFSSIEEEQHLEVVQSCYWPLLRLAEQFPNAIGIEISASTLERVADLDYAWISTLRRMIKEEICELVGSGYTQIIGPLAPSEVNQINQQLGQEIYSRLLGVRPTTALINEQAWSQGILDHYLDAGYQRVVMEWDNPSEQHPDWPREWRYFPQTVETCSGGTLSLLWNQSIQFQRFQRYVHGELLLDEFIEELAHHIATEQTGKQRCFALYGNDAEIFDFRPGRFHTECELSDDKEWVKIERLFHWLKSDERFRLTLPTQAAHLSLKDGGNIVDLRSPLFPVPVKKQRKYNIARWAVTGRDDLWLNTISHRLVGKVSDGHLQLEEAAQKQLCRLWSSDLRTHITTKRWHQLQQEIEALGIAQESIESSDFHQPDHGRIFDQSYFTENDLIIEDETEIRWDRQRKRLQVSTPTVQTDLNLFRGASFYALAFGSHQFTPLIGTIPHGYFDEIDLGADFYSGTAVMELTAEHRRITDLVTPAEWFVQIVADGVRVIANFVCDIGAFSKEIFISSTQEHVDYAVNLSNLNREQGIFRVGHFTLLPPLEERMSLSTKNGGEQWETVLLDQLPVCGVRQVQPASTLVTSTSGFGAVNGELLMSVGGKKLSLQWDPAQCALFPMLDIKKGAPSQLVRLIFSLAEMDDTWREGGKLLPFSIRLSPTDCNPNSLSRAGGEGRNR